MIDGKNAGSPITLSSGMATYTTSTLSVSTKPHTVKAAYSGDSSYTGRTASLTGGQTVNKAATSTALASSLNPSTQGQAVTFTATITVTAPGASAARSPSMTAPRRSPAARA